MKSYQQLFAEMKRRKVFKVAAVYGIVAFGLLQVAEPLATGLGLPDTFLTYIVALLLLGFPVALVLAWAFEVTPDGMQKTVEAAPGEIEAIVSLPASQRWPAGLMALAGIAALIAGAWWVGRQTAPAASADADAPVTTRLEFSDPSEDDRPSIAVLPFVDMSPEGDQEYFGDGMTEEILNTLAGIRELRVSGRTSGFAYKGLDKDLREIGQELGVGYLIEGSVRKSGDQLRITAQLIDASDGSHLWSDSYNRAMKDVFAIQIEIAESVADALRIPLGLQGDESLVTPITDLDAYDLYLAGRSRIRARGAGLAEAAALLAAAIARDSTWAPAWAGLAEATELRVWYPSSQPDGMATSDYIPTALDEAERAARRALELDPENASALVALGSIHRDRAEWEDSEAAYRRAIALDPDNGEAHQQYGELLLNVGRAAEAVRAIDRAAVLDPAAIRFSMLAAALDLDHRLPDAIEAEERHASMDPGIWAVRGLLRRYLLTERWEDAVEALDDWNRSNPDEEPIVGDRTRIAAAVDGLRTGTLAEPVDMLIWSSDQWSMIGQPDSAVAALVAEAEDLPFGRLIEMRRPHFQSLRSHPSIEAFFAERGMAGVAEQRTPEAEHSRPMSLGPASP